MVIQSDAPTQPSTLVVSGFSRTSRRLKIVANDPFQHTARSVAAFAVHGNRPDDLDAAGDFADRRRRDPGADARPGRDGCGEADAVAAAVDGEPQAADADRVAQQHTHE